MSLRRRLTLFFIGIVVLPLAAAGVVIQRVVVDELESRALLSLKPALGVAKVVYEGRAQSLADQVAGAVNSAALPRLIEQGRGRATSRYLSRQLDVGNIDFLVALDRRGRVVGRAREEPDFEADFRGPSLREILQARTGLGFTRTEPLPIAPARGRRAGTVIGGFWTDADLLVGSTDDRVELGVVVGGSVVAATEPLDAALPLTTQEGRFDVDIGGAGTAEAVPIADDIELIAWAPASPIRHLAARFAGTLLLLLLFALVATALLAYWLARLVTRPLTELASGAKAIAEGRFDHRIAIRSRGEVGELAAAFNDMSDHLNEVITQLSSSQQQLQRAVQRVGELFRSTHDMDQILESILETARDAVDADAAILWRLSPGRGELDPLVTRGIGGEVGRLAVGSGVAGSVAQSRAPKIGSPSRGDSSERTAEPDFPTSVAAPFYSQSRLQGVIVAYRRDPQRPFGEEDLSTVAFLAEQGGVAIENVKLHEESQRLSLTDGLTGTWNRRYFQMQFRQVLATAVRFERPFSVLMLDLDHFKLVNDSFGHQRGDSTLVEFTRRVTHVLREVDTFARYGGEEFICLLPETDYPGALTTADKILDAVKKEPFGERAEEPVPLTVSIGIASYPIHGVSFSALVEAADQALYRAKQEGRNRVIVAGEQPPNLTVAK